MRINSHSLWRVPLDVVRVECQRCGRTGSYRLDGLMAPLCGSIWTARSGRPQEGRPPHGGLSKGRLGSTIRGRNAKNGYNGLYGPGTDDGVSEMAPASFASRQPLERETPGS